LKEAAFSFCLLEHVSKIGFERARLQPCRKKPKLAAALLMAA
jgi:hypothetical protein